MSDTDPAIPRGVLGQRPSRSADTAWRDELERICAMSVRERVELALRLGIAMKTLGGEANTDRDGRR